MAEVGVLPFAGVALQVATRFSKHQFTQPQLLAVLCLMRYEDWTFREAEVRLREHQELRAALQLPERIATNEDSDPCGKGLLLHLSGTLNRPSDSPKACQSP